MVTAPPLPAGHSTVIAAGQVVTSTEDHRPGWVEVAGEHIRGVGPGAPPREADLHFPDAVLVPGYIDAHAHGGGGASYTDATAEAAARAAVTHLQHGTTTTMASLVTASLPELERAVKALAELVDDGLLAGIHLEGPWLSRLHCGAHDPALLRAPDRDGVDRLLNAGRETVRMVTLAPELDGGIDAVRRVVGHGAVAAVGHTDAGYDVTRAALAAGARCGTHLFNAMRPLHHREPGPVLALLDDERAFLELIADGDHLHPAVLRDAARVAGAGRFLLVTDAMAAAGAPDGDYCLGALAVLVREGRARLSSSGAIAGSTLTLSAAVRYAVHVAGLPLVDTIRAATTTPAALLGLQKTGALEPGYRADLLVLDSRLDVVKVMRAGRWSTPAVEVQERCQAPRSAHRMGV